MNLFPNPTSVSGSSTLQIESAVGGEIMLTIRDLTGRTLSSSIENIIVGENTLDLSALMPSVKGSYTLTVNNSKGISSQKFEVL